MDSKFDQTNGLFFNLLNFSLFIYLFPLDRLLSCDSLNVIISAFISVGGHLVLSSDDGFGIFSISLQSVFCLCLLEVVHCFYTFELLLNNSFKT